MYIARPKRRPHGVLTAIMIVALIAMVGIAFVFLRSRLSTTPNLSSSNSANSTDLIELSGKLTQGPTRPICDLSIECYAPVANRTVQAMDSKGIAGTTKTDDQGSYTLRLKPGHYALELVPQVDAYHLMNNQIDLTATNNKLNLTLDSGIR